VEAAVANTGKRAGETVVQLYLRDLVSSVTRPVAELAGFARVSLAPGESKRVGFDLGPEALALYDEELKRVVEPGTFEVRVGTGPADLVKASFEVAPR
jgi:beta-glucosidase